MGSPSIPNPWTINLPVTVGGSVTVDMGLDDIEIKAIAPITLNTTSTLNSTSTLDSTSKVDLGLDDIRIKELPKIDLHVELAMKPTRIHFPVHLRFCLSSMGMELLAFSVCGESMVVIEDYFPHKTELCR
jgi:hypothetical protein